MLCESLGNPQLSFPAIHLTGTNGKTSTARLISSILTTLGLKVGTYTSPHLESCTERITLSLKPISKKEFASYLSKMIPYIEAVNHRQPENLTYFEILTGCAFLYFAEKAVDCGVIEVGMGGKWDATNIVCPRVAVITNVQLDHTDMLGNTHSEIALEKVKIIKNGCQVVTAEDKPEILGIIKKRCVKEKASFKVLGRDFSFLVNCSRDGIQELNIAGLFGNYDGLLLPLIGSHQAVNAALAVVAVEAFCGRALPLRILKKGLAGACSPGRLEVIAPKDFGATVVLDGAHNPAGATALAEALRSCFDYSRLILVLAILQDKDIEGILNRLAPLASMIIFSENQNSRSASVGVLKEYLGSRDCNCAIEPNLPKAIDLALNYASREDLICITGSLYTVGEAREYLKSVIVN